MYAVSMELVSVWQSIYENVNELVRIVLIRWSLEKNYRFHIVQL